MSKPFVVAAKEYFGLKAGQSLMEFKKEVDALTDADRAEMAGPLGAAIGDTVTVPPPKGSTPPVS